MDNLSNDIFGNIDDESNGDFTVDGTQDSDSVEELDCLCPICLDTLTRTGLHMATSLKCGHQFGYTCIRRCLKRVQYCPICNKKNYQRHMRGVYQRIENRWDRTSTEEDLAARERRRLKQLLKRAERRATRRLDRQAGEAEVAGTQDDEGDGTGTAASCSYRTDSE